MGTMMRTVTAVTDNLPCLLSIRKIKIHLHAILRTAEEIHKPCGRSSDDEGTETLREGSLTLVWLPQELLIPALKSGIFTPMVRAAVFIKKLKTMCSATKLY